MNYSISKPNQKIKDKIKHKIDNKTKPPGSLGKLEEIALQICLIQQTDSPELRNPNIIVFSGDHGIANEGVSPFPQEVTRQMVLNFIDKGAAINVFSKQHNIHVKVVDSGVKGEFTYREKEKLLNYKIAHGTQSFLNGPAMTEEQCRSAMAKGAEAVKICHEESCNVIGFGEMGIANTSSSALLMHTITGEHLENCVGKGTGLDDEGVRKKKAVLEQSLNLYNDNGSPLSLLAHFGGFETAMITGAFLKAAELNMTILVDGFNVTAAFLVAHKIEPKTLEYCIFSHQSDEKGHRKMLEYLNANPLLKLNMRLGEGTGAAVAYPIVVSAVNFINEMASFEKAGVSNP